MGAINMNVPFVIMLSFAAIAFIISAIGKGRVSLFVGVIGLWLCICFLMALPFGGAARVAAFRVSPDSADYQPHLAGIKDYLKEIAPVRLATVGISLALCVLVLIRGRPRY